MVDTPAPAPAAPAAPAPAPAAPDPAAPAAPAPAAPAAPVAPASLIGDALSADKNGHDPTDPAALKAAADKAAADKAAADKIEADKAAALAWKPADLKLPEGFIADDKGLAAFSELGTKHGITKDAAQALFDIYVEQIRAGNEAATNLWNTTQEKWQAESKALPAIGGAALPKTMQTIAKAIDQYGGADAKAIRDAFTLTGFGNHPMGVKFIHALAKELTEGPQRTGQAPMTNVDPAKSLYPNLP